MTLKKIARQASQDSPYRIELWDYIAEHMADRADIFGSAAETARATAADPPFRRRANVPTTTSTPSRKPILVSGGTPTPWLPALTLSTMQDISLAQAS